jgi:hypothetical protein
MLTVSTLDYVLERGEKALLVERDTCTPDIWKAYTHRVLVELIDTDEGEGWIHLVNARGAPRDSLVVVNTAARNNVSVKNYGKTLDSSLDKLGTSLGGLRGINRRRERLELVNDFVKAVPKVDFHLV